MIHIEHGGTSYATAPQSWRDRAACFGYDPETWFSSDVLDIAGAKQLCRSCEVINECLRWSVENREEFGVWGGHSAAERDRLLRRHRARPSKMPVAS